MGRQYDLTNVQEAQWINEKGEYIVKVSSVTHGFTAKGNEVEKVVFKTKDGLAISDDFVVTNVALYRMKNFTKALKLPTINDTDEWIGRYVKITVGAEGYTKKDGSEGTKHAIVSYEPSILTNSQAPKQTPKATDYQPQNMQKNDKQFTGALRDAHGVFDLDDEEIPF
jgi:hypothetical protein